jgi:pimeloyl-ACP methyl ester carboxylesterase
MPHTLRTRFAKDIVAEFLPPARPSKTDKVIIICGGMPSYNSKDSLIEFYSRKGYWVIAFRYRGSWESAGKFLRVSPERDVLDIIDQLPKGFVDLWSNKKYKVQPKKIFLFGTSFGGPASILASRDKRINKVVALSPVVDWRQQSKGEPLDFLYSFTAKAFGEAYRLNQKDWAKLKQGKFYNPVHYIREIDGDKLFIIHAKDDNIVNYGPVAKFARETRAELIALPKGGHLRTIYFMQPRFYKRIQKFLKS